MRCYSADVMFCWQFPKRLHSARVKYSHEAATLLNNLLHLLEARSIRT